MKDVAQERRNDMAEARFKAQSDPERSRELIDKWALFDQVDRSIGIEL